MSRTGAGMTGLVVLLTACAVSRPVIVRGPIERVASPPPAARQGPSDAPRAPQLVKYGVVGPVAALVDAPGLLQSLMGIRAEAYNLTAADDVEDPDWFERRDGLPAGDPPDTSGPWTVVEARGERRGAVTILDARAREYWLTFDAPGHPELGTGFDVIAARLLWAAGYHVPETHLVMFDPRRQLGTADTVGPLARAARRSDGRVRAVAHRVPGAVLGSWALSGRRHDNPADDVPHEHRRELRGLYVVTAWLNHTDLFPGNTLDVLVDSAGRTSVRHYLLGLESSFGSRGGKPATTRAGVEADLDAPRVAARLLSFGFYAAAWERSDAVGFDPARWTPSLPNPAFSRRTARDGYWGAKLVAGVTEPRIRAAVRAGELGDTVASAALVQLLLERRAATVRYWYALVTPLEEVAIDRAADAASLVFRDLAVTEGLVSAGGRRYEIRLSLPAVKLQYQSSVILDLTAEGRGALWLPPPGGPDVWPVLALLPVERQVGWVEVRAVPSRGAAAPRAVRVYLLPDRERGWRVVGRRY